MVPAEQFLDALKRRAKLLAPSAIATYEANTELATWLLNPLARWTAAAYGPQAFDDAAVGYAKYALGVARAQQIYEKNGRYTPEAMPEIVTGVYEDASYMVPYMWAAILIYAFWPSMIGHLALFRDQFVRQLPANASVLELASGHGVMSLLVAEERPDVRVWGFDISPPAVAVATRLLAVSGHEGRVSFAVQDAIDPRAARDEKQYEGIVSAMLAEHLESPQSLLAAIARRVAPTGAVFFSTALESAQRDHVYEFNHESEPIRLAEDAGLRVQRLVSDGGATGAHVRFQPRATAMILQARVGSAAQRSQEHNA